MKNLDSARLKRYRVEDPALMAVGFKAFFPGSQVYTFEFPLKENMVLRTLISTHFFYGVGSTRISASILNEKEEGMATAGIQEIYLLKDYIQYPDECMVWQLDAELQQMRVSTIKSAVGVDFDWRHCPLQFVQYSGEMPPLKNAYAAEMMENGQDTYCKGSEGKWRFVRLKINPEYPWEAVQEIARKVFKNNLVQVFFNEETRKHPDELILWYNPSARPIV